jgi:hypothetical protein
VSTTEELHDRKVAAPVYKTENTTVGIRHADHVATSIGKKLAITSLTIGGRSVGIVRSRTQTMEFSFYFFVIEMAPLCVNVRLRTYTTFIGLNIILKGYVSILKLRLDSNI